MFNFDGKHPVSFKEEVVSCGFFDEDFADEGDGVKSYLRTVKHFVRVADAEKFKQQQENTLAAQEALDTTATKAV